MFDQKKFDHWQALRSSFKEAKKEKDFEKVIRICKEIITLDAEAAFICIMKPLFYKEIGSAYLKLDNKELAANNLETARDEFINYRKTNPLNKPDDWLKDIEALNKKIEKLRKQC